MKKEVKSEDEWDSDDEYLAKKEKKGKQKRVGAASADKSGKIVKKKVLKTVKVAKEENVVRRTAAASVKEEKRKFEKPGQRRETPPKSDPLRMFYESMYVEKQRKGVRSELAENWLVMYGVLDEDVAAEIVERRKAAKGSVYSQESSQKTSTKKAVAGTTDKMVSSKERAAVKLTKASPTKKAKVSAAVKARKVKIRG